MSTSISSTVCPRAALSTAVTALCCKFSALPCFAVLCRAMSCVAGRCRCRSLPLPCILLRTVQSVPRMPRRVPSSVLGVGSRNTQCKDLTVSALMVFAVGMSATAAAALHPVALHHHCSSLTHWQLLDGFISAPRSRCSGCGSRRFLPTARVMSLPSGGAIATAPFVCHVS